MNFRSFQVSAVVATALVSGATLAGTPAQALTFTAGSELNLSSGSGQVNLLGFPGDITGLDFVPSAPFVPNSGLASIGSGNTGDFASFFYFGAVLKDLTTFVNPVDNFLTVGTLGSPIYFDLTSFVFNQSTRSALLTGFFELNGEFTPATGVFTTQGSGPSPSWSMTLTAIPTPALLPGLLAMGVGILRKRKQQQVEA